jgi:hypothetical protein
MVIPKLKYVFIYTCNGKYSHKDLDRYSSYVNTTTGLGPEGDCWEWGGGLNKDGYGQFRLNISTGININMRSSRVSYETSMGIILTSDQYILHSCDNRKCVNIYHLKVGTHRDNMKDMINRNRQATGERNGYSKLTQIQVNEIRRLYATGKYSQKQLAKIFNISQPGISLIIINKTWINNKYVTEEANRISNYD